MNNSKIRKIISKKFLFYPFLLLFIAAVTLVFIPHYSCACGEIKKNDGSMFRFVVINTVKDMAKEIKRILK